MLKNIGISLVAIVIAVVISIPAVELYLRFRDPKPPINPSLMRAEILGWDSIPPVEEISTGKSGDTILFVGDSFTKDVHWTKWLTEDLNSHKLEVNTYSLGVSGYGTIQEYLKLCQHIVTYRPQKVVLLFYAWNDLRDNLNTPGIYYNYESLSRPTYNFSSTGKPPKVVEPHITPGWQFYSRIYQRLLLQPLVESFTKEGAEFSVDEMTERTIRIPLYYTDERA